MPTIKPFKALRPLPEYAATIAALPYDVQSVRESRDIVASNPLSFLAIDEPVVNFPEGTDPSDHAVYSKAAELLDELEANGYMKQDDEESFYVYEQTMDGRVQNGLVGCVSVDDYLNGVVKRHEATRVDKEADRMHHVRSCKAHTGPIFLAYHYDDQLARIYEQAKEGEPLFDFTSLDGIKHRGFAISPQLNKEVADLMAKVESLYIADGHHRTSAAAEVAKTRRTARGSNAPTEESDYFLAVMFADAELKIWPYERVVKDLNGLSEEEFLDELRKRFDVAEVVAPEVGGEPFCLLGAPDAVAAEELLKPRALGEFCVFTGGRWYRCFVHAEDIPDDPHESLEVSLLQNMLFSPVLGIVDPRRSPRIDFVGGIRGLAELERRCQDDCVASFALSPTGIQELFTIADAHGLMPPKSTWFEPKLRSGLFIHKI